MRWEGAAVHATGELTQCSLSELTQCSLSARVSFVECARARFSARYATLLPALRLIAPPSPTERAPGRSARRATQQAARADLLSSIQTTLLRASQAPQWRSTRTARASWPRRRARKASEGCPCLHELRARLRWRELPARKAACARDEGSWRIPVGGHMRGGVGQAAAPRAHFALATDALS